MEFDLATAEPWSQGGFHVKEGHHEVHQVGQRMAYG
jgi:hypothetical protein